MLLPLSAAACSTALTGAHGGDVVIAADLELSGAYADVGTTYQRALKLKIDQINAAGGVQGRKLRLEVKDNRSDPTMSAADIDAFSQESNIGAIVMGWCAQCLAGVTNTLDDKQIPVISLSAADSVVQPASTHKYIFKIGPNAEDTSAVLASQLKTSGVSSVALLATDDTNGNDTLDALKAALKSNGLKVRGTAKFPPTDTDLEQPVSAAISGTDSTDTTGGSSTTGSGNSSKKPDALVISAFSTKALLAAQTARSNGFTGGIYFDQTAAGPLFLTGTNTKAIDGTTMVSTQSMVIDDVIATNPAKIARRQWFNDYTSKYGNFSEYSAYAADAVQSIVNAMGAAGSADDHAAVRDAIETGSFEGFSGPVRMSTENHSGLVPQSLTLLVAHGDRWQPA